MITKTEKDDVPGEHLAGTRTPHGTWLGSVIIEPIPSTSLFCVVYQSPDGEGFELMVTAPHKIKKRLAAAIDRLPGREREFLARTVDSPDLRSLWLWYRGDHPELAPEPVSIEMLLALEHRTMWSLKRLLAEQDR